MINQNVIWCHIMFYFKPAFLNSVTDVLSQQDAVNSWLINYIFQVSLLLSWCQCVYIYIYIYMYIYILYAHQYYIGYNTCISLNNLKHMYNTYLCIHMYICIYIYMYILTQSFSTHHMYIYTDPPSPSFFFPVLHSLHDKRHGLGRHLFDALLDHVVSMHRFDAILNRRTLV